MLTDLIHNKIIKDTITDGFVQSVEKNLVPKLKYVYGEELTGVCMYEDYLSDGFLSEGQWYYPLTVITRDGAGTRWISWGIDDKNFTDGIPYSYVGEGGIDFKLAEDVPEEFRLKTVGRAIIYKDGLIPVNVHAVGVGPRELSGKYSQSFADELARQITEEIKDKLGVVGLAESSLELQLVFAPGTYMEHTSENVTYRRLLMTGKGCRARDFWVKWERLDAGIGYSVSDAVSKDTVKFTLGEDVAQKIREKEYRFLCGSNPQKYQSAMGKKTVTEWRELIKTAIKRGELTKIPTVDESNEHIAAVDDKLRALLASMGVQPAEVESVPDTEDKETESQIRRVAFGIGDIGEENADEYADSEHEEPEYADSEHEEPEYAESKHEEPEYAESKHEEPEYAEVAAPFEGTAAEDGECEFHTSSEEEYGSPYFVEHLSDDEDEQTLNMTSCEEYEPLLTLSEAAGDGLDEYELPLNEESAQVNESEKQPVFDKEEELRLREARIRAELEAKIRREIEAETRAKAEDEQRRMQLENDRLARENERLLALARQAEERRAREQEARRLETERIARERELRKIQEQERRKREEERYRLEQQERNRLAETARRAVEEQRRLEAEKAEREAKEEAQRLERERFIRDTEARRVAEQKQTEQLQASFEPTPKPEEYVSKYLRLQFGRIFDMNVLKQIKEIVEKTIVREGKADVRIAMRAYPVDSYTINLDVAKIPKTEERLLLAIVQALGHAKLGITKIVLE